MSKSVYFHIDEVARDSVVAANLRKILAAQGVELVYGNRFVSYILRRHCPFDAVVMPTMTMVEEYFPDPAAPIPPVIVLPTEGVGGILNNPERAPHRFVGSRYVAGDRRWLDRVFACCVWGQSQRDVALGFDPDYASRCHVIGHPRLDRRCIATPQTAARPDDGRVRIGLISRFGVLNPFDSRSILATVRTNRKAEFYHLQQPGSTHDVEDMIYTQTVDLRLFFDFIDRIDPARHDVTLRIHPRENRLPWEQMIAAQKLPVTLAPWDQPFLHWVDAMDWIVSPPSTSFYDCFAAGKPVLCTRNIAPERARHVIINSDDTSRINDFALHPDSMDALMATVAQRPAGPTVPDAEVMALLEKEADYPACRDSLDRLAGHCLAAVAAAERMPAVKWGTRAEFDQMYHQLALELSQHPVYRVEQGSTFRLDAPRRDWIDALAANPI